ncbi:Rpn family recombination-promoting nuclease/putative transposase [Desulfovibrionales bacterium]
MTTKRDTSPHDGSYKNLFSHKEMVETLIRDFVSEDWVDQVDFSTLEKQNGSYVTDDLRERHDDVIWRVRFHDQWFYLYLLIEFQSEVDPWMSVRMMVYVGLLYQDLIKPGTVRPGEALPPIFPLVLYRGRSTWTARTEISELIVATSRFLSRYQPRMEYFLVAGQQESQKNTRSNGAATLLMLMERCDDLQDLSLLITRFINAYKGPQSRSLRRAFAVWVQRIVRQRLEEDATLPEVTELEEVLEMLTEQLPLFNEKWIAQGRMEGRMEGEAQGLMKGQATILKHQIAAKFGDQVFQRTVQEHVQNATPEQLALWAERILFARTIDEVFSAE